MSVHLQTGCGYESSWCYLNVLYYELESNFYDTAIVFLYENKITGHLGCYTDLMLISIKMIWYSERIGRMHGKHRETKN